MTTKIKSLWLKFTLLSDATFGRGDGVAGLVDAEVQHDEYGLPYLGGKTLRGLLGAECAEILFALEQSGNTKLDAWQEAAQFLFGKAGSRVDTIAQMQVSDAQLPEDLRTMIMEEFRLLREKYRSLRDMEKAEREWGLKRMANLNALTALRKQTAMDAKTGAPLSNSLRTMRVILRETFFISRLDFNGDPDNYTRWLLAACIKAFHRAGTGRNRGRGRLQAALYDQPFYDWNLNKPIDPTAVTSKWFTEFAKEVQGESNHISHSTG